MFQITKHGSDFKISIEGSVEFIEQFMCFFFHFRLQAKYQKQTFNARDARLDTMPTLKQVNAFKIVWELICNELHLIVFRRKPMFPTSELKIELE